MTLDQHDAVVVERRIAARPEIIFPYLIDPEKMTQWHAVTAELDPRPGGLFRVNITGVSVARGTFVEVSPNQRVVFTWGWENPDMGPGPGESTVEITLTTDGDATIVRIHHYGLSAEQGTGHEAGWEHYADRLAVVAAGGDPGPDPWAQRASS